MPKCLLKHNHTELEKEIEKYTLNSLSQNSEGLLGMFTEYYNNFRYANYVPGRGVIWRDRGQQTNKREERTVVISRKQICIV